MKMTEKINLREIEKKSYRFTFKDGIYDIAWGTLLLSFALAPILREIIYLWYIVIVIPPAPLIIILGKRFITAPRIGIVKFDKKRSKSMKKMILISSILVPITIIILLLTVINIFPGDIGSLLNGYSIPIGAGIFAIILLSVCAYLIDFPNMYIYGIIIGLGIPITEILQRYIGSPTDNLVTFGITGLILLIFGLYTLIKFIQKYPIPQSEIINAK
jgi:hypothetical protein